MPGLTVERLREVLHYDPATGLFRWLVSLSNKGKVGSIAGSADKNGYVQISIDNMDYKAHRLAWIYVTGSWPKSGIDHRNTISCDNRWDNLRELTQALNSQNTRRARSSNKTGLLGVSRSAGRFKAQIMLNGKQHNLGRYKTAEEAQRVYISAKRTMHEGAILCK